MRAREGTTKASMTEVPKIVYDRLRAGLPGQAASGTAHPDADLLTAFADQALSGAERDNVLEHLAFCGNCREVVALALPEETVAVPGIVEVDRSVNAAGNANEREKSRLSVFAWPTLRWAALAAGVALAASVLLLRPEKPKIATLSSANPPANVAAPMTPALEAAPPMDHVATLTRNDVAKANPEPSLSRKLRARHSATEPVPAESGMLIANKKDSVLADKPSAGLSAGARSFAYDASTPRATTEQVEVSGAAVAVESAPSAEGTLMARNEAPAVVRAKPALPGLDAKQQKVETQQSQVAAVSATAESLPVNGRSMMKLAPLKSAPNVAWMIAGGILQQSTDSGKSWQSAVHVDHPLLCYASHDQDVWAGGKAGTLFHSADGGSNWAPVQPSSKGHSLGADVTHIDVRGPAEVVVSTNNNETWTTADGGKSWEKK
jgi:Putative zinc-finger/Photosynthesis system II assembly factor YCF48